MPILQALSSVPFRRRIRRATTWMLPLLALLLAFAPSALARSDDPVPPPPVQELIRLLEDPAVRDWLQAQRQLSSIASDHGPELASTGSVEERMVNTVDTVRARLLGLVRAIPKVPNELAAIVTSLKGEMEQHGLGAILLLLLGFAALGFGAELVFWRFSAGLRERILASRLDTPSERLRAVGIRLGFGLLWIGAFALGSVGAFLLFSWPPLLHRVVLTYLLAFLAVRLAVVAARFFLAPDAPRFRIVPMDDAAARHWARWFVLLVGWFVVARSTLGLLPELGTSPSFRALVTSLAAAVWLALGLVAIWRRPANDASGPAPSRTLSWALFGYLLALLLLVLIGAPTLFWLGLATGIVPLLLRLVDRSVTMLLRSSDAEEPSRGAPSLTAVCLERGLRALVIAGAIVFVARVLGLDLATIAAGDSTATRLFAGALKAGIILLALDFFWHLLRAWIDRRLAEAQSDADPGSEEARRHARQRTLLPILRNVALIVAVSMAVLMTLSSLGFEIGPLIAGAGVVGVAVGFGAQTIVRDVIAGIFYLMDDAFRVGEYIQSGSYKGTVESFSLRSVKLRHHRGPLYTVPFGSLGAIQNMSRDWVIDKTSFNVPFDTDLDKGKKIIKEVSKELMENEEFRPDIIEPLKMQGVEQFGDFAITIRMKIKTKPGRQFTIRRRAFALVKKKFADQGIRFATPTVQVAGGSSGVDSSPAVAKETLDLVRPKEPAA